MAEYFFDSGYYLEQSVVSNYVDLYLEGNKKSSNKEMQQLIEKKLPEKTNSFKEKIELDKKFFAVI